MKFYFKVVWECGNGETAYCYYESTSVSALISYLGDNGFGLGMIIEIKRVSRLPKVAMVLQGCYE